MNLPASRSAKNSSALLRSSEIHHLLKHAGDYRSVYAHLNKSEVRKGQFVERRQAIAEVGTSGNASGPHLHFEIRRNDRPQDPMRYLP